ncbi:MAG: hypothetical protein A2Y38_02600 [Spirochaetes bacterium GWB1_59_5]|nr:MAG: hypothetical protein A2Y38_02600 [Spirochaetes bacterium GWB1_59_5]
MALPDSGTYQAEVNAVADALYRAHGPGDATGPEVLRFMRGAALRYVIDTLAPAVAKDIGTALNVLVQTRGVPSS